MVHKPDWMLQVIDAVPASSAGKDKERDKGYVKYQLIQQGVRRRELYEATQDDFIRMLITDEGDDLIASGTSTQLTTIEETETSEWPVVSEIDSEKEPMKIISIFNNKGGVGKTTYLYHVAHLLAKKGKKVLLVDLDAQCNLSAYAITDKELEQSWNDRGNSIWNIVKPVYERLGDVRNRKPTQLRDNDNLFLVPGDVLLSNFEDTLGNTWSSAKGGDLGDLRVQSAIYRYIKKMAKQIEAGIVLLDLGPNLGALNRAVLSSSHYFIVPISPDLFSIRGTRNLGDKLVGWHKEWNQCKAACTDESIDLPVGQPTFLGYVTQQHNVRSNKEGMTKGWALFGDRVHDAVQANIVDKLKNLDQVYEWKDSNWNLGKIPNLHSLIPYSLEARKPVFECSSKDGLTGAHISSARESSKFFEPIVERILQVVP